MGLRDRLRIERIKQGLELPISMKCLQDNVAVEERTEDEQAKSRQIVITKCPDITSLTEIKTCNRIMRFLSMPKVPHHVVAEKTKEGMYKVIAKLEKAGETKETIFSFYWAIPEFQKLWIKLGYSETDWRSTVNGN